ncbi:hypothetical protein [Polyangium mundeleinium]|uniref:Uncharacterized protein n=1 Tax=Polyangium mundeleinium TaxID=2995306 RepID=A0ABT5ELV3_9BACT|nr:hypothetical protein [Polyangium mundeleinium]MDC0741686.1 hypothetical protein [Polyangium mundeleinium]
MAKKREVQVNAVSRYEKSSGRLVLEEYSSCEVPAGCGGAILRWIDPHEALPLHLWLWTTGQADLFFDGAPFTSSRVDARAGSHVLALYVRPKEDLPPQLALSFGYSDDAKGATDPARSRSIGRKIQALSGAGAVMVGSTKQPRGDGWRLPGFDDGRWQPLVRMSAATKEPKKDWHLKQVQETGACIVGLPGHTGPLWVRCSFELALGGAP